MKTILAFSPLTIICMILFAYRVYSQGNEIISYQPASETDKATDFRLWANEKEIFVYSTTNQLAMVVFDFVGKAKIRIEPRDDIKWLDIRPKFSEIDYKLVDNNIYFEINEPVRLSIELNNESTRPLYIFAGRPLIDPPNPNDPQTHYFKQGQIYDVGQQSLNSGDKVYIEGGAIVNGSFIATDAENIDIRGRGILNGTSSLKSKGEGLILLERCKNVWIEGITLYNSATWTLKPTYCEDISIRDIRIVNWRNGSDGIDLISTRDVVLDQSFIRSNDDCFVIKSLAEDDENSNDPDKNLDIENIKVSNSVFWNMSWGNALEIGYELRSGLIQDITFENCDILHVDRGAAISIHNGDRATVRNITYSNIRVEDAKQKLIDLAIFLTQYSLDRPSDRKERSRMYMHGVWDGVLKVPPEEKSDFSENRGHIEDITFSNIEVNGGAFPFSILSGYDNDHMIKNIKIENLNILGTRISTLEEGRFFLENAENVILE